MLISYQTYLIKKTNLSGNVYLFEFFLVKPKEINFLAGQYLILSIPFKDGNISRLYSISSSPWQKNSFELVVELIKDGIGSDYLKSLKINDKVFFKGPAGVFTIRENKKRKVFFATGTGIAPIRSMIYKILNSKDQIPEYLFWGLRKKEDVYFLEEFKKIAKEDKNFKFKICLSKEENLDVVDNKFFSLGHVDYVFERDLYSKIKNSLNDFEFYLCGGRVVVESLIHFLQQKSISLTNIFFEKF